MGVRSGLSCVINGVSTGRNWSINELSDAKAFVASNTQQGTGRRKGNRDWNGTYGKYGYAPVIPGSTFSFLGYAGSDGSAEASFAGNAIIDSVAITWNWGGGEIISTAVNFSGNGAPTGWGTTTATDTSDVIAPAICGTKVSYGDVVAEEDTDWDNVTQAVLTLTCANQAYVNSSTACWNARKRGPALDFTLAITEQNSEGLPAAIAITADEIVNLYVNATQYFELKKCHVTGVSGLTVDRESGAILQRTVNLAMSAFYDVAGTPTVGSIKVPGGTQIWPFS